MTKVLFFARSSKYVLGLPQGFEELGCQVYVLRELSKGAIQMAVDEFRPDIMITTGWAYRGHKQEHLKELADKAARYKIQHLYWATEDPRWTLECSFKCVDVLKPDAVLTIHPQSVAKYLELGMPAGHLDFGCNPDFNKTDSPSDKYAYDIAVIGNGGREWKSYRKNSVQILLKPLVERRYNIAIWGRRWEYFDEELMGFRIPGYMIKGKLPYEETNKVYNSAKIILGFQNHQEMLTSRTFEVLGSGGFLLTPSTNAVNSLFNNNVHLMCSSCPEDTINIVNYFLGDSSARQEVSLNGQSEVYARHTYKHRAAQVIEFLNHV